MKSLTTIAGTKFNNIKCCILIEPKSINNLRRLLGEDLHLAIRQIVLWHRHDLLKELVSNFIIEIFGR